MKLIGREYANLGGGRDAPPTMVLPLPNKIDIVSRQSGFEQLRTPDLSWYEDVGVPWDRRCRGYFRRWRCRTRAVIDVNKINN